METEQKEKTPVEEIKKIRQIIIETDGNSIFLSKADVAGVIELTGILQTLISYINQPNQNDSQLEKSTNK